MAVGREVVSDLLLGRHLGARRQNPAQDLIPVVVDDLEVLGQRLLKLRHLSKLQAASTSSRLSNRDQIFRAYAQDMARTMLAGAGGGVDAIAAVMVHRALHPNEPEPIIATYAWDRLLIEPVPGPRTPTDFDGLARFGELNYEVTASTAPRPPAGSTLPRLAAELAARLMLLDPTHGARGTRAQLGELASRFPCNAVEILDVVGGDILSTGNEDGLQSPLADALALAATDGLSVPTRVLVASPGLDGELSNSYVRGRTEARGGKLLTRLARPQAVAILPVLSWHLSEATSLLAAAALGQTGRVEDRDSELPVNITIASTDVLEVDAGDVLRDSPAREVSRSQSIAATEEAVHRTTSTCELEYEKTKSQRLANDEARPPNDEAIDAALASAFTRVAIDGVDFLITRRLIEAARGAGNRQRIFTRLAHRFADRFEPPTLEGGERN